MFLPWHSPQGELTARRDQCGCETVLKVQNQEEMGNPSPGESLRIWDSLSFQPSATLSTDSFEQHLGKVASPRGSLSALPKYFLCCGNRMNRPSLQQNSCWWFWLGLKNILGWGGVSNRWSSSRFWRGGRGAWKNVLSTFMHNLRDRMALLLKLH